MYFRKTMLTVRLAARRSRLIQCGLLGFFWAMGETAARLLKLPVPGGVLGLALVLLLLALGWLRTAQLRRGAEWLLAEMLLFFVPAVLAVLDHKEFLGVLGLKLLASVLLGTLLVMGGTGLAVDMCCRLRTVPVRVRHESE